PERPRARAGWDRRREPTKVLERAERTRWRPARTGPRIRQGGEARGPGPQASLRTGRRAHPPARRGGGSVREGILTDPFRTARCPSRPARWRPGPANLGPPGAPRTAHP